MTVLYSRYVLPRTEERRFTISVDLVEIILKQNQILRIFFIKKNQYAGTGFSLVLYFREYLLPTGTFKNLKNNDTV